MPFKAISVDDDPKCLSLSIDLIESSESVEEALGFTSPSEAFEYLKVHYVPVVFLDIRMPGMDGITLAEKILSIHPKTNIIFLTTYSHYLPKAFSLHASGYCIKPLTKEKLDNEISNLRYSIEEENIGFYAHTFGTFSFYYDGNPVVLSSPLDEEVLAYLFDANGIPRDLDRIARDLEKDKDDIGKAIKSLESTFIDLGEDGILFKTKKGYFLDVSMISSDVQEALKDVDRARKLFKGEYLSPYKWAYKRREELISIL